MSTPQPPMTDREAFQLGAYRTPDDDLPKLVYADWLEENATATNGYAKRAKFIRLMCQIRELLSEAKRQAPPLAYFLQVEMKLLKLPLPVPSTPEDGHM